MRFIGNLLWLVIAGIWLALGYALAGIISFVFIITIPLGVQSFKLAGYALWPFGRVVVRRPQSDVSLSTLGNVIWFVTSGWWLAFGHLIVGAILMITIIGFPLGVASWKMAGLALFPFGKTIVARDDAHPQELVVTGPEPLA